MTPLGLVGVGKSFLSAPASFPHRRGVTSQKPDVCHNFGEVVLWITSSLSERMHLHVFGLFLKGLGGVNGYA